MRPVRVHGDWIHMTGHSARFVLVHEAADAGRMRAVGMGLI